MANGNKGQTVSADTPDVYLPPLHGGYKPRSTSSRQIATPVPKPPKGRGAGSLRSVNEPTPSFGLLLSRRLLGWCVAINRS